MVVCGVSPLLVELFFPVEYSEGRLLFDAVRRFGEVIGSPLMYVYMYSSLYREFILCYPSFVFKRVNEVRRVYTIIAV